MSTDFRTYVYRLRKLNKKLSTKFRKRQGDRVVPFWGNFGGKGNKLYPTLPDWRSVDFKKGTGYGGV